MGIEPAAERTDREIPIGHDANDATPAVQDIPIGELVNFDYKGRGHRLHHE